MEKLALEIFNREGSGSKKAFLPSDTSITITDTSEIFDSGDIWSHAFKLNIHANAHIFGTSGEMHGSRLHEQINKRRARLWVLGLPLYYGYLKLDDEVDVDSEGDIDISFESGQKTFKDMIEGAKANQVPLKDDVFIGMALEEERGQVSMLADLRLTAEFKDGDNTASETFTITDVALKTQQITQNFPKYVRPKGYFSGGIGNINTVNKDNPYDADHQYCNTRICYQKYVKAENNGSITKEKERGYVISGPSRINTAPNFFVLYWLDCLMKHLKINVIENQMMDLEDFRRLFFVNTKCAYKTKDGEKGFSSTGLPVQYIVVNGEDSEHFDAQWRNYTGPGWVPQTCKLEVSAIKSITHGNELWDKAYATSENFPNVDINDVIEAIENGFGVRLLFDRDFTKVRMVFMRNILRSQEVHNVSCEIMEVTKQENCIRGFRLTYGGSEDDTNYVYKGFVKEKQKKEGGWVTEEDTHDYSQFNDKLTYEEVKQHVTNFNKTCYIVKNTGNSYIIKVDKDARNAADKYYPSLLECAGYMDAEDGDCTGDEETVKEIRMGFSPAIMNIVPDGFALFIAEEMGVSYTRDRSGTDEPSSLGLTTVNGLVTTQDDIDIFAVATPTWVDITNNQGYFDIWIDLETQFRRLWVSTGYITEGYALALRDNYEVDDELISPLEKCEWGLTLGVMRGSGYGKTVEYSNDDDDLEGNEKWELIQGSGAYSHPDVCNDSGSIWGDTGSMSGRISLKLRSEKPNPFKDPTKPDSGGIIRTREQAKGAMELLFTTSSSDLFTRVWVNNDTLRAAGWNVTESGVTRIYGVICDVTYNTGNAHHILWTPIKTDGTVLTPAQLEDYIGGFDVVSSSDLVKNDTLKLILDVDTTTERVELLNELQKIYYTPAGFTPTPIVIQKEYAVTNFVYDTYYDVSYASEDEIVMQKYFASIYNTFFSLQPVLSRTLVAQGWSAANRYSEQYPKTSMWCLAKRIRLHDIQQQDAYGGWYWKQQFAVFIFSAISTYGVLYTPQEIDNIISHVNLVKAETIEPTHTSVNGEGGMTINEVLQYLSAYGIVVDYSIVEQTPYDKWDSYVVEESKDEALRVAKKEKMQSIADLLNNLSGLYSSESSTYKPPTVNLPKGYSYTGERAITQIITIGDNPDYIEITNPALRRRGLAERFYKEYSYWVRNARIAKMKVRMELAQLLSIDKTKRVRIGDITGFLKKIQYTIDMQRGFGDVSMEIWYL